MQARSKKHLAMLVGMALSVSVGVGMNPMEAYAASNLGDGGSGYTDPLDASLTGIDIEGTIVILTPCDTYDYINDAGTTYALTNNDKTNTQIDIWKDETGNDTFTVIGNLNKIAINSTNKISPTIVINGRDDELYMLEVAKGTTGTINVSGAGEVVNMNVQEDIELNSSVYIAKVNIDEGKTLTSTSTLQVYQITGKGSLDAGSNIVKVIKGIDITGDITAKSIDAYAYGDVATSGSLDVGGLKARNVSANSVTIGGELNADNVSAASVTLAKDFSVVSDGVGHRDCTTIEADTIKLNSSLADVDKLKLLQLKSKSGDTIKVEIVSSDVSAVTEEQINAVKALAERSGVKVTINTITETPDDGNTDDDTPKDDTTAAEKAQKAADAALEDADKALKKINEFATVEPEVVAAANPFTTKLPGASDIAAIGAPTEAQKQELRTAREALNTAMENLDTQIDAAEQAGKTELKAQLQAKRNELEAKVNSMTDAGMETKATQLRAAVQEAGKTAAAPGIASARTAAVITEVMTNNVVARTSELRTLAAAVDDGRPAPDNLWFQYKHTNMDVDRGSVYSKSTVKTNNYQLGYDTKIGENDYLGAYIGTTDGSVEFNGPAQSGDVDIKNSFEFGIYGTHMLPADQYIDYMIHTGKFDSKYSGETWGTRDTGAMVGYGAKIAANERLTWNPYVQLAYDKVSVDSYKAGENNISSDKSNNWTAKLGINLMDASGLYGGLAYSRGLSGSYNAYINGVPMPTQDNKANVIYLSLGYRATLSKKVFLDVSAEKTFADYKGWTATGKVNFYF